MSVFGEGTAGDNETGKDAAPQDPQGPVSTGDGEVKTNDLDPSPSDGKLEGVPDKFQRQVDGKWQLADAQDILKSYTELEKEAGRLRRAQPDKPPGDVAAYLDGWDLDALKGQKLGAPSKDDPAMAAFMEASKEAGVSVQQARAQYAALYAAVDASAPDAERPAEERYAEAVKAMGPSGEQKAKEIAVWGNGLVQQKVFGQEHLDALGVASYTKEGLEALHALRTRMLGMTLPTQHQAHGGHTKAEVEAKMSDPRYFSDESYAADVQRLARQVFGEDGGAPRLPSVSERGVEWQM